MTKLILGCGYLGLRVGRRWLADGGEVVGLVRSPERAEGLSREGIRPIVADVTRPETLRDLPPAETVLYSVGFDPSGGKSRWEVYVEGLGHALQALRPDTPRLIFISSTGVYGEADNGWVDEDSPCHPARESGRALLAAEKLLAAHPLASCGVILRLAGLYGPGRLPRASELLSEKPLARSSGSFVNLIHVDDAAAVVLAAEVRARPPCTYVVSDGHPAERRAYDEYVARLLGARKPQFVERAAEDGGRDGGGTVDAGRGRGGKRVRNRRMLKELRVRLLYPTFREGLAAAVWDQSGAGSG
jgi:nucleoside-diphosphate-sugar epimerase